MLRVCVRMCVVGLALEQKRKALRAFAMEELGQSPWARSSPVTADLEHGEARPPQSRFPLSLQGTVGEERRRGPMGQQTLHECAPGARGPELAALGNYVGAEGSLCEALRNQTCHLHVQSQILRPKGLLQG